MSANFYELLKYAATGIASPDMTYYDMIRASTLMGGAVQTLTGQPPLSFKANGKPLISFSMKGNGSQNGTPTPDNPVMPEFVGVRTGNLVDPSTLTPGYLNTLGSVSAQGGTVLEFASDFIPISGSDYTWSLSEDWGDRAGWVARVFYDAGKEMIGSRLGGIVTEKSGAFSVPSGAAYVRISWRSYGTIAMSLSTDASLLYEPFGWAEKITCAGQTVPVYLGQVSTVRRVKKLVLTGEETIAASSRLGGSIYLYNSQFPGISGGKPVLCSHLKYTSVNAYQYGSITTTNTDIDLWLFSDFVTASEAKQYLREQYAAGNPVTVWYVLATPTTGIVNEPLAKIGDYADELHSSDTTVSIPTIKGSNTLTVETELQPSEMTITFKG